MLEREVNWLREGNGPAGTLSYALPGRFDVYGAIDLPDEISPTEDTLLSALAPNPAAALLAGWIDRGPWPPPHGDEFVLYWGWRYRFRWVLPAELQGLPSEGEDSFPDLLFPPDRSWLVSLLWDDSWRSVGASEPVARRIEQRLPAFERLSPTVELAATGRVPN